MKDIFGTRVRQRRNERKLKIDTRKKNKKRETAYLKLRVKEKPFKQREKKDKA